MVPRFSQPPTLGEFIAQAKRYGYTLRFVSPHGGRRGPDVIGYLWRNSDHFAELPGIRENDRLTRDQLELLCSKLAIPLEDLVWATDESQIATHSQKAE